MNNISWRTIGFYSKFFDFRVEMKYIRQNIIFNLISTSYNLWFNTHRAYESPFFLMFTTAVPFISTVTNFRYNHFSPFGIMNIFDFGKRSEYHVWWRFTAKHTLSTCSPYGCYDRIFYHNFLTPLLPPKTVFKPSWDEQQLNLDFMSPEHGL